MGISAYYGPPPLDEQCFKVLNAVYEHGIMHWDTADAYGDSEELMGRWFKRYREFKRSVNGEPEYVPKALQRSLDQLGVDYVDLWYLHGADIAVPIELTVKAMAEQVKAGKVRYLGLSEKGPEDFAENDYRRAIPRNSKKNFANILKIAEGFKKVGEKHGATAGQVALAWVLAQGDDIIPIVGTTKLENLGALKVKLPPQEIAEVRHLAGVANAAGGHRYPESMIHYVFADTPPLQK